MARRALVLVLSLPTAASADKKIQGMTPGFQREAQTCATQVSGLRMVQTGATSLAPALARGPDGARQGPRGAEGRARRPVIFMTARVQPREVLEYRRLGSLGVIPKPFDPNTLAQSIQGMWDRHCKELTNETRRDDLGSLRLIYAAELPGRLQAIEDAIQTLRERGYDAAVAGTLYEMAHRLAGSAAIYGFREVSEAAGRVGAFSNEPALSRVASDLRPLLKAAMALSDALRAAGPTPTDTPS